MSKSRFVIHNLSIATMERLREDDRGLKTDHVYFLTDESAASASWAYSPDGVGCIWYDTFEELAAEHG